MAMSKETWKKPKLQHFGDIEKITKQGFETKNKKRGFADDFAQGISNV